MNRSYSGGYRKLLSLYQGSRFHAPAKLAPAINASKAPRGVIAPAAPGLQQLPGPAPRQPHAPPERSPPPRTSPELKQAEIMNLYPSWGHWATLSRLAALHLQRRRCPSLASRPDRTHPRTEPERTPPDRPAGRRLPAPLPLTGHTTTRGRHRGGAARRHENARRHGDAGA